jgi:hypothetical protein
MKHSVKVMSFVMALSVTTAMVPQASAQTQPAKTQQLAQAKQPAQAQQHDNTHSKGQGCGSRSRCRSHLGKRLQGSGCRNGSWRYGALLAAQGGKNAKKRAVVAVARKLALLLHELWVSRETKELASER